MVLLIVVTKVNFLRLRFYQWSQDISLDSPDFTEKILRDQWPEDNEALCMGLAQIANILGSATSLSCRYRQDASTRRPTIGDYFDTSLPNGGQVRIRRLRLPADAKLTNNHEPPEGSSTMTRKLSFLRLKFKWAVQDKKRLNSLVTDLESLISSLEELSVGFRSSVAHRHTSIMPSEQAHRGERVGPKSPNTSVRRSTPSSSISPGQTGNHGNTSSGGHSGDTVPESASSPSTQPSCQIAPQDDRNAALNAALATAHHHVYIGATITKSSGVMVGDGKDRDEPRDRPGHIYYGLLVENKSAAFLGNSTTEQMKGFFDAYAKK
ncbi:hypothetical protein PGQ11_003663 [Apiospora arundinis]|uniref:Prion-inhibition and propagation HeLo domain-containing protein n=1 Tax=Apiospora arundinis TaxID=335852 RepID=A0ABR2J648_9PEZI